MADPQDRPDDTPDTAPDDAPGAGPTPPAPPAPPAEKTPGKAPEKAVKKAAKKAPAKAAKKAPAKKAPAKKAPAKKAPAKKAEPPVETNGQFADGAKVVAAQAKSTVAAARNPVAGESASDGGFPVPLAVAFAVSLLALLLLRHLRRRGA